MPPSADPGITTGANSRRRGRLVAAVLAVVLGLGGALTVGYAVDHQQGAPPPLAAASLPGPQTPVAPVPSVAVLSAARPISIRIPAINVSSPVTIVGLNPDHTMEVPHQGPLYDQPAWYRYSPTPGERGPSVIIGHVDSAKDGPSVFFTLGALKPGQRIEVARADGTTAAFEVDSVGSFPKDSFPTRAVYGDTDHAALRLITCGGSFDETTHSYRNNIVVFAHLIGPAPA
ncbi:MAG TPA: class F sortase [Pseudonocardiaceae bacterium]|nr:class F sortase [Pseudonocardiaceae bacterium]